MLKKLALRPSVNRENTRYTNEGGYYESDKIRFRQGTPEKIGGWERISSNTFLGFCRSLWNWVTLAGENLVGVGTTKKFYVEKTGSYYDITPIRATTLLGANPFATNTATNTGTTTTVTVTATGNDSAAGDYVTFYGATTVAGLTLNGEYSVTPVTSSTYTITVQGTASSTTTGGGSAVYAAYQLTIGQDTAVPPSAWGGGGWGSNTWGGAGVSQLNVLRLWTQFNYGQNLVFGPKSGTMYYWDANFSTTPPDFTVSIATPCTISTTVTLIENAALMFETTGALPTGLKPSTVYYIKNTTGNTANLSLTPGGAAINTTGTQSGVHSFSRRAIKVSELANASSVPLYQNVLLVSDASNFVFAFGTNEYLGTVLDPMLIRWSDQENIENWAPAVTNQAGSLRLSHGSQITCVMQARQEILVWTDAALYALQYLGAPYVWGSQLLSDNISIVGINSSSYANGTAYWMGTDKFYKYDGRVQTLRCDLRQFIYDNINKNEYSQIFSGTNEGFNEIWWFYCSKTSNTIDRYVTYNYAEDGWAYGTLARTAWLDTSLRNNPIAATYSNNLVRHESGVDDNTTGTPVAINATITTAEFDIDDGYNFAFVWRMLPDLTFRGSTDGITPSLTMQLLPLQNSGSGYNDPKSVGGFDSDAEEVVQATQTYPIDLDTYNGQVNIRIRGRQMAMRISSNQIGVQWQLGSPRIDLRVDGRR